MENIVYNMIIELLESMGFIIFEKDTTDIDIRDYIADSLQFMDFIVRIEEEFTVNLPDDFLGYDILSSCRGFVNMLIEYFTENNVYFNN